MRHDFLDRYSRLNSPLHRLPAGVKLVAGVAIVVTTVSVPLTSTPAFTAILLFLLGTAAVSRIPPAFLLRRIVLLEPFVLGISLLALFQPHGAAIVVSIVVRSTLCLFTVILLSNSTPFSEVLQALRRAHVSSLLLTLLALMYRYLFLLIDEAERMKRARMSRSFTRHRAGAWVSLAATIGQLFVRSTERAERIFAAMSARGWK